jgi:agmatinase
MTNIDIKDLKIHDYGNIDVKDLEPSEMIEKVRTFTSDLLKKNKFPIAIGGEHSITSGIVQAYPKDIAVLSLDAHMDFRDEYENEKYNHACVIKRISEHITIKSIAILGVRSAEKEEYINAKKQNLFYIDSFEIKKNDIEKTIEKTKNFLKDKKIYLTLDIDSIDPSFAPGTSTPEPFGITPFDLIDIIDAFSSQLIGFDVMEVCPDYDNGETSILAGKIIRYVIEKVYD